MPDPRPHLAIRRWIMVAGIRTPPVTWAMGSPDLQRDGGPGDEKAIRPIPRCRPIATASSGRRWFGFGDAFGRGGCRCRGRSKRERRAAQDRAGGARRRRDTHHAGQAAPRRVSGPASSYHRSGGPGFGAAVKDGARRARWWAAGHATAKMVQWMRRRARRSRRCNVEALPAARGGAVVRAGHGDRPGDRLGFLLDLPAPGPRRRDRGRIGGDAEDFNRSPEGPWRAGAGEGEA